MREGMNRSFHVESDALHLYLTEARDILLKGAKNENVFVQNGGKSWKAASIGAVVLYRSKRYAADIMPLGVTPHMIRHMIASDYVTVYPIDGVARASKHLATSEGMIKTVYGHRAPNVDDGCGEIQQDLRRDSADFPNRRGGR